MWEIDVAVNTAKAVLPFSTAMRRIVRARRGYPVTTNAVLALEQGLRQIEDLRSLGIVIEGCTILDLGSGWHPIVPLLFRVAGADTVHLSDAHRLMDADSLTATIAWLEQQSPKISRRLDLTADLVVSRSAAGRGTLDQMLARLGMCYHVPFSSSHTPPVDIVISRVALEHIPPAKLRCLHGDFARALRPNGVASHVVDNSDHREHRDKRLSRIEFLRHQDVTWRLLCLNPQDYCNRLRHSDHVRLMREAGFELLLNRGEVDAQALSDAGAIPLAEPWHERTPEDLATVTSWLVGRVASIAG